MRAGYDLERCRMAVNALFLIAMAIIRHRAIVNPAGMFAKICLVVAWRIVEEECAVVIDGVDAERPRLASAIDRAIEIFSSEEIAILTACEHVIQVFIADVKQRVVLFDGIAVAEHDIVHNAVDGIEEIEVDFIDIVILCGAEVKFIGHTVAQESCMIANCAGAES